VITTAWIQKHYNHVAKSGIIFLEPAKSSALMIMILSSAFGNDLVRPLAGGNSEKSTYWPETILSTSLLDKDARPRPVGMSLGIPLEDCFWGWTLSPS
jgi:hypothetical protein